MSDPAKTDAECAISSPVWGDPWPMSEAILRCAAGRNTPCARFGKPILRMPWANPSASAGGLFLEQGHD